MSSFPLFQVDAFAENLFEGNPAAVCLLSNWLSDDFLQKIASENNLSETAFVLPYQQGYQIRWFTPNKEVALCGHATLASAFVLFEKQELQKDELIFYSQSGELRVKKQDHQLIMDFPSLPYTAIDFPSEFSALFSSKPSEIYQSTYDLMLIYENSLDVRNATLNLAEIANLSYRGIILSSLDEHHTIYSRCFYPAFDVAEDPVTGSAHCVIAPYWANRLKVNTLKARQGLKRQGQLTCHVQNNRVFLAGSCRLFFEGICSIVP